MTQMIEICIEEGVTFYQSTPVKYIEGNIAYTDLHEITFDHVVMASQYPVQTDGERRYALQAERAYIITASGYDTFKYGMFQYMDDPMMSIRHFHTQNGEALILAGGIILQVQQMIRKRHMKRLKIRRESTLMLKILQDAGLHKI